MYISPRSCLKDIPRLADGVSVSHENRPTTDSVSQIKHSWLVLGCTGGIAIVAALSVSAKLNASPQEAPPTSQTLQIEGMATTIDCTWNCLK